ncbi:MAG: hypothetical protein KAJ58_02615 [Candidatus Pacebacteria bacterium]|nr:hypothetical protein [Candidatus Paceibacterota bacterium]
MFLNKNNLHHAYLLEGEKDLILQDLLFFLEKELNFQVSSNPDLYLRDFVTFGIDDGKIIKDFQSKKSITGDKQIIIIQTNFITNEAQNSLLKMFEEPTENVYIFLIIQSSENLLATLKSRLQIIKFENNNLNYGDIVENFLKSNLSQRFDLVKEFLPKTTKDKADKVGAIQFLNNLERVLYEVYKNDSKIKFSDYDIESIFSEINKCRSYLNDRSPSVKMILEHISQIVPEN